MKEAVKIKVKLSKYRSYHYFNKSILVSLYIIYTINNHNYPYILLLSLMKSLPIYRKQLLETLSIKKISNFAYGESLYEFYLPHLNIFDISLLNLLLYEYDVKTIIAQCAQAPFGHREETVIDTIVYNTQELSPTKFTIKNKNQWDTFIDKLAEKIYFKLGFTNAIIEKKLYKLLIYKEGGFF